MFVDSGLGKLLTCEDVSFALQQSVAVSPMYELNCP